MRALISTPSHLSPKADITVPHPFFPLKYLHLYNSTRTAIEASAQASFVSIQDFSIITGLKAKSCKVQISCNLAVKGSYKDGLEAYGSILDYSDPQFDGSTFSCTITFDDSRDASKACLELDGKSIRGSVVEAKLMYENKVRSAWFSVAVPLTSEKSFKMERLFMERESPFLAHAACFRQDHSRISTNSRIFKDLVHSFASPAAEFGSRIIPDFIPISIVSPLTLPLVVRTQVVLDPKGLYLHTPPPSPRTLHNPLSMDGQHPIHSQVLSEFQDSLHEPVSYSYPATSHASSVSLSHPSKANSNIPNLKGEKLIDHSLLAAIERGEERRRTYMLRNIPNKYTPAQLLQFLDERCAGGYDFFYLRMMQCRICISQFRKRWGSVISEDRYWKEMAALQVGEEGRYESS